jgi:hypothetical protein
VSASDPSAARSVDDSHRPDPWGVKRAENLLQSLQGVLSARLVVSPVGEIIEVHVLANSEGSPKQVVRNVESALLAQLGLKVDHRKISVAQTAEVEPIDAAQPDAAPQSPLKRGILYDKLEVVSAGPNRVRFVANLDVFGEEVSGEALATDSPTARLQGAARAAIVGLEKVIPQGTIELDGVTVLDAFGKNLVVVGLHAVEGRDTQLLVGTAGVRDSTEPAAVLAVLDATNRWLQSRYP